MTWRIPKLAAWCSYCIERREPCLNHRSPTGDVIEYAGRDAYEPSSWVLEQVGRRFTAFDWCDVANDQPIVYVCTGYDPRHGFWMQNVATGARRNISERAIGRTYHRVEMTCGASLLLEQIAKLGRMPSVEEADRVSIPLATRTLLQLGYITANGAITDSGRTEIERMREEAAR